MSLNRARVYAHIKNDRLILDGMDAGTGWVGSTDVSNVDTNTNHREGTTSLSFDKDGTTEAFGTISKTLDADNQKNLVDFLRGSLRFWVNLSSLTNVANVQLIIGENATDNYVYQIADSDLSTGWNEVAFDIDSPTSTGGAGAAWSSIGYIAIKVNFDAAGNTLTEILVDAVSVIYEPDVNVESINLSGSGLSTAALQTTGNAILTTIDTDTGVIAGDTTSIDGKTPALGTALMAASAPVTIATDDTVATDLTAIKTAVEIMDDWDETDRAAVNLIVGQAGVAAGAGASDAGTIRVVLSSDSNSGITDETAFVAGTTTGSLMMGEADETATDSVSEGDVGGIRMSLRRAVKNDMDTLLNGEDETNVLIAVATKPLSSSTYSSDTDLSAAAEASSVTKASAGNLFGFTFSNGNAAIRFLQFFNSTTVPADTAVPVMVFQLPASTTLSFAFNRPVYFSTGISWANSSTQNAKTIGSADSLAWVSYK